MDAATGEIVALEMRDNMKKELCLDTVNQLEMSRKVQSENTQNSEKGMPPPIFRNGA